MLTRLTHRRVVEAKALLCADAEPALSIADVARHVGASPSELVRRFTAVLGETPHRYRTRLRLEHARRMLVLEQASVTEVCMAVGFTSLGSFSALFSRHFGEAPSACRRRLLVRAPPLATPAARLMPGCLSLMTAAFALGPQFSRSAGREQPPYSEPPRFSAE